MAIAEIEKKLDKIYINQSEFKKIQKFLYGKNPSEYLDKRMFFPLKNFVIDIQLDKVKRLKALVELDTFNPTSGRITTDDYFFTYKRESENRRTKIDGKGASQNDMEVTHVLIVASMVYICLQSREKEIRQRIEHKREKSDKPYEYRNRECFLLNEIIEYVGEHPNRKSIQYQCECWGVRGHLRHYTDGRVTFIEPYKKGRKRDVLEPKSRTYLLGYKE